MFSGIAVLPMQIRWFDYTIGVSSRYKTFSWCSSSQRGHFPQKHRQLLQPICDRVRRRGELMAERHDHAVLGDCVIKSLGLNGVTVGSWRVTG